MFLEWFLNLLANSVPVILKVSSAPQGAFPRPLTKEEEEKYLKEAAEGDIADRNMLVEHNLRLVAHIVKKYYSAREDHNDLISIGTIGLIKAVCSFNGTKGTRLATYAARCIENEILMYFRSLKKQAGEISLSEPIDSDKDGNALSLMDVISCDDTMLEDIENSDMHAGIYKYIFSHLDQRERDIIIMRYGLFGKEPLTQREVAFKENISRSYVSRIEKKALLKLREVFQAENNL